MFQTQEFLPTAGMQAMPLLSQSQMLLLPGVFGLLPPPANDNDINVNFCPIPGPPGPAGPPGPPGPPGSLENVPVTLIDEPTYTPTALEYLLAIIYDGQVTVTLPAGVLGKVYVVKDAVGDAGTNPITVVGPIDGSASYVLDNDWASITIVYNGIEWNVV